MMLAVRESKYMNELPPVYLGWSDYPIRIEDEIFAPFLIIILLISFNKSK